MPTPDENAAILRPVWEALVDEAFAHVVRVIDGATSGGLTILIDRTEGMLPGNRHGMIADESIAVDEPDLTLATDQETLNRELLAAVAGLGGGGGRADYLYWSSGATATDPEWLTYGGKLLRRRIT